MKINLTQLGTVVRKQGPTKDGALYKMKLTFDTGVVMWLPLNLYDQCTYHEKGKNG